MYIKVIFLLYNYLRYYNFYISSREVYINSKIVENCQQYFNIKSNRKTVISPIRVHIRFDLPDNNKKLQNLINPVITYN